MTKYLKVMADYSSTGLWDVTGELIDAENYNISPSTAKALRDWCNLYEQNDDYLDGKDRKQPLFDLKSFSKQGLEVAKAIKKELPDYTIVYFNDYLMNAGDVDFQIEII